MVFRIMGLIFFRRIVYCFHYTMPLALSTPCGGVDATNRIKQKGRLTMQAYKAHYEKGLIVPLGNPVIPEGSELIVTVLEPSTENRAERQRNAFRRFMAAMESAPPLPDEFDEIISRRVNIQREAVL